MTEASSPAARSNPPPEYLYARKWPIFGVMMIGWFMSLLDVQVVNVAIVELQRELDTDIDQVTWVVNAYAIAFAVVLVGAGRLADQFGRKRLFLIGLTVFTVASGLCAVAWDADSLILFRILQGLGAGTLAPLGFVMTALVFPPAERGRGLALIAVIALAASATGPVVGGAILEVASWHFIFLINLPIGLAGLLLCLRIWPETYDLTATRRVDWPGMALLAGAVVCVTYGLVDANARGWDDGLVLFTLQAGVLLTFAFFAWERRSPDPMLPPALLSNRQFVGANLAMILFAAGALGALFLLSLVFVGLWGWSIFEAALGLTPVPLAGLMLWPIVGRGVNARPPRRFAVPALVILAAGLVWLSFLPPRTDAFGDYLAILPGLVMFGIGLGSAFPAINVGAMGSVSGPELGVASGLLNTARQLGLALGIALLIAALSIAADARLGSTRDDVADLADVYELPVAGYAPLLGHSIGDFTARTEERLDPAPGFERRVYREAGEAAADSYGWAFRVAALLALLAVPLARTMVRTPMMAMQEAQRRDAEQQPPEDGDGSAPGPERIAELERSVQAIETELAGYRGRS